MSGRGNPPAPEPSCGRPSHETLLRRVMLSALAATLLAAGLMLRVAFSGDEAERQIVLGILDQVGLYYFGIL